MYVSTRGGERVTASRAIIKGLAADGGLFVPEKTEEIGFDESYAGKDYKTFARKIFAAFFDDFTPEEIEEAVESSYNEENFPEAFARVNTVKENGANGGKEGFSLLELYHGPTLAFKDMALTALPHLLNIAKRKNGESGKTLVLVATSGDTGGAALSGFGGARGYDTLVLYPAGGVSEVQERQMLHFTSARTNALAMRGNFDDCQTFVKRIFSQYPKNGDVTLCSANSINIGRLVPQIVYYAYAYFTLVKRGVIRYGEKIDAVVPTGNFGDILAGYLAKKIGVPYGAFVCASNKNNVLTDFFKTGVYDKNRPFYKSNSPAMDILVSSNLERLLYFASGGNAEEVKEYMSALENCGRYEISAQTKSNLCDFACGFADEQRTLAAIKRAHDEYNLLIDPHTAVAFDCYETFRNAQQGNAQEKSAEKRHTLIVSTASPFKFPSTMCEALHIDAAGEYAQIEAVAEYAGVAVPSRVKALFAGEVKTHIATREEVLDRVYYRNRTVTVRVPATSANLGSAFDCAGVALTAYNVFRFEESETDDVSAFSAVDKGGENLILKSYKKFFEVTGKKYVPVRIYPADGGIGVPFERGLGSSATCVVAGVLAANYFTFGTAEKDALLSVMTEIEGHPDNVVPAYLGGMVCSITENEKVRAEQYDVSEKLVFTALVPPFSCSTREARRALPQTLGYKDIVFTLSRAINLPRAMERGDQALLKEAFKDKLHQPYRLPLIDGGEELKKETEEQGFAVAVSGSGSTLLAVGEKYVTLAQKWKDAGWRTLELSVAHKGAEVISQ